ncbi:hypothetical protein [Paraclostridium sordellii]|uniref:hypothetical protein n=1 Tax=Paraclostridium sordellii TaxID=1505 RepID=UPI0005DAF79E|nr:hypothetical protein [Paeniclostridium sordellii]CEO06826.1 ArsR family transcriptional regulator [[Clostridium] sordellii] [Paeniclostridium sordellii]CEP86684.1 ArsR family transcriptional regulator [[Clostridium] sordellii] [Paeniclostridium sordellii]CEP99601.1 ArsR family transcriptional regulator [[Clostridium] sordellii] [Paeniclostridium sordellii]
MEKECEERLKEITSKFKLCQKAISAMGDETRQLILLTLLESDFNGIRVGEITKKNSSFTTSCISSS